MCDIEVPRGFLMSPVMMDKTFPRLSLSVSLLLKIPKDVVET